MLKFKDVTKDFQNDFWEKPFRALDNVSFSISPGKIVGFLGANGAGKTTSIKILLNFIRPKSGSVEFDKSMGSSRREIFKKIGYLPERPYFYPDLTGRELLKYIGEINDLSNSTIAENTLKWTSSLKIDFALDRKLKAYSKGMLQRLGFASALLHNPELLILDEPLSGLDPIGRREFKDIMNSLKRDGKTIFFSSHILSDVEEVSSDVVILESGKHIYSGSLKELLSSKSTDQFELTIGEHENFQIEGIEPISAGSSYKLTLESKDIEKIIPKVIEKNIPIESLKKLTPTLEEIIYKIGI